MNLTSDYPFWGVQNGLIRSYPRLDNDETCDCVIVGGGITGALVAFHMVEAGVSCVVLDKRDIGTGSTSGSTGLLQYEIDVPLRELQRQVGAKDAARSYLLCGEAIDKLRILSRKLHIPCGFVERPSLLLARHQNELDDLREEFQLRRRLGIDLEFWSAAELQRHFSFRRPGALFSQQAAEVDPHALTHGLLQASGRRGVKVFDRCPVVEWSPTTRGIRLRTEDGFTIDARRAVIAAGYEAKTILHTDAGSLKSTYALVSEPVPELTNWYRRSLIWETDSPYLYLRTTADRRIIVGGEDESFVSPTKRDALISQKAKTLVRKFGKLFPEIKLEVAYAWAGTFGETKDGLPYIGGHKSLPHAYFALGYGGNGITFSLIAAEIIRDNFLGRKNADGKIFAFDR